MLRFWMLYICMCGSDCIRMCMDVCMCVCVCVCVFVLGCGDDGTMTWWLSHDDVVVVLRCRGGGVMT